MHVSSRTIFTAALVASLAAGCSGTAHETPLPAVPAQGALDTVHRQTRLMLRITIPKRLRRHVNFVSPSTKSIAIAEGGRTLGTFDTTATSSGCQRQGGATACLFTIGALPGANQTFEVTAYDQPGGKGTALSAGSVTQKVVAGQQNFMLITLSGTIASVTIALQGPNPSAGTPSSIPVTVMAKDADGNVILGPGDYDEPVTLTNTDSSGIASLSVTKVNGPGTIVSLSYNGKSLSSATIGATVNGLAPGKITAAAFAPAPAVLADYQVPLGPLGVGIEPTAITTGPDGNIWFGVCCNGSNTTGDGIVKMTPSGTMTYYVNLTAPSTNLPAETIDGLTAGPDGNVWYAGRGGDVGSITPSGNVTSFPLTGGSICAGAKAWRIIPSADGGFWVTIGCTGNGTQVAHVTTGGTIAPYNIPGLDYVNGLLLGKDGNLYVAGEMHSNGDPAIAQAIVSGATIASTSLLDVNVNGADTNFTAIVQTPDGDFWATYDSCSHSAIARIHPAATFASSAMSAYNTLAGCAYPAYGVVVPDGTMWFANDDYPILTRVTPGTYPAAPSFSDFAMQSTVEAYEWDVTIGADGNLYVSDYDSSSTTSGDILKVAY